MYRGAMCVSMYHECLPVLAKTLFYRCRVDIHDRIFLDRGCLLTQLASLLRKCAALAQRLAEEVLLPGCLAHHGAKLHVLNIVTAQVVAMQHDGRAYRRGDGD